LRVPFESWSLDQIYLSKKEDYLVESRNVRVKPLPGYDDRNHVCSLSEEFRAIFDTGW